MRTEEQKRKDNNLYVKLHIGITDFLQYVIPGQGAGILLFDIKRTVYYGKTSEYIPDKHYDNGIVAANKDTGKLYPVVGMLGMSKATRKRYRKVLVDLGIERVEYAEGTGKRRVYIDVDRLLELIEEGKKKMLKLSKKRKKDYELRRAQDELRGAQYEPTISNCIVKGTTKVKSINKAKASPRTDSLSTAEKAKQKHLNKRKQKADKIIVPTIKNAMTIWAEALSAYKENNPSAVVPPPTHPETRVFVRRTKQIVNDSSWQDVLYRAVSEWDLLTPHFTWVDSASFGGGAPSVPSLQFIRSFYQQVIEAQQEQLKIDASNKANADKRSGRIAINDKKSKKLESKIQELEKKLAREKVSGENSRRRNNELSSKLAKANEDKAKLKGEYYSKQPALTDEELMSMDLPEYEDLPQNNVH